MLIEISKLTKLIPCPLNSITVKFNTKQNEISFYTNANWSEKDYNPDKEQERILGLQKNVLGDMYSESYVGSNCQDWSIYLKEKKNEE